MIDVAKINFLNSIRAQSLHARRARHRGRGDDLRLTPFEQTAKIDLGVQHEFLPLVAIFPKAFWSIEPWR